MAINTQSLTQLITEFRALQNKNAITPESLGYILQRIADLLATAGTSETIEQLQKILNSFSSVSSVVANIVQGQTDRNHIYANITKINPNSGAVQTVGDIFIQQATTERAGAMRAQQVTDLNTARNNINSVILPKLETLENAIATLQSNADNIVDNGITQISCEISNDNVVVRGASALKEEGYIPYLFRFTRKRNHFHDKYRDEKDSDKKYCNKSKGWHLWGSSHSTRLNGSTLTFSTNPKEELSTPSKEFSTLPSTLVKQYTTRLGKQAITWGRARVLIDNNQAPGKQRMIRLRFGVGFAKEILPGKVKITPANLVTNLAEFSIVYNPRTQEWKFSK